MTAFVKSAGGYFHSENTTTLVIGPFASAPASSSNTIIVGFSVNASLTATAVSDNQGNTYVIDKSDNDAGGIFTYIARSTSALGTGSAITITLTAGAAAFWSGNACEYSGVPTASITTGTSGAGATQPFSATTASSLNASDLVVATAMANGNSNPQGLSDPPTGGTGTWTSRGSYQNTTVGTCSGLADKMNGTGGTETATWAVTAALSSRIGIIVGYASAASSGPVKDVLASHKTFLSMNSMGGFR